MNYSFFFIEFINPKSNLVMSSISCTNSSETSFELINPSSLDKRRSVSSSVKDPSEIYRKCKNSFCEFLAEPSEIFVGIDTAALLNWEISPNFSSEGNSSVNKYIFFN